MVDCFDRIAVHMTELVLQPVRQLSTLAMLGSVSLRTPSNGRRFLVTISKRFPDGEAARPRFVWKVEEITPEGGLLSDGKQCAIPEGTFANDPESAYWAAVDGLCEVQKT